MSLLAVVQWSEAAATRHGSQPPAVQMWRLEAATTSIADSATTNSGR